MDQSDIDLLSTVPSAHLQTLLKARNLQPSARGQRAKQDVSSSSLLAIDLAPRLFDSTLLKNTLHELGEVEHLILFELVSCGGRANSRDLALYLTQKGAVTPSTDPQVPRSSSTGSLYPSPHPHGMFELALRQLLLQGLVFWGKQTNFAGRDYANGVYDGIIIAPKAVIGAVESLQKTTEVLEETREIGVSNSDVNENARLFQRKLYLYCSLLGKTREGFSLLANGLLSRPALRTVLDQLAPDAALDQVRSEMDIPQLLFIRLLLIQLNLAFIKQNTLFAAPAEDFFSLSVVERVQRCYRTWLHMPFWNELLYLPDVIVRPQPAPTEPMPEEAIHSRQAVIERILHEPERDTILFAAFISRTKLYVPYLLFPRRYGPRAERYSVGCNPYGLDFRLKRGWLTHRDGWHMVEGGFIRAIINGPLSWLGMVEVERGLNRFNRLPGSSALMSDKQPTLSEQAEGRLIVQANFELLAMSPVSESLLIKLDRFAERVRLEQVAQYRLTRSSVTYAFQLGSNAEEIVKTLEEASNAELPQNVSYTLNQWDRQARRIELWHDRVLLEVADPARLKAMQADERLKGLLGRQLSDSIVEVAATDLEALQNALWEQDLLPALTAAPMEKVLDNGNSTAIHEPQWRLDEAGLLEPINPVSDLYLVSELQRISEFEPERGWYQVTQETIQQAREDGIALEQIVRFLQNYCLGGIPNSFLIRLKLWGGGYADHEKLQVEPSPLLRLSEKVLMDLRQDAELNALLGSEVPTEDRLVRIAHENLERLIEVLKERGFTVE